MEFLEGFHLKDYCVKFGDKPFRNKKKVIINMDRKTKINDTRTIMSNISIFVFKNKVELKE